MGLVNFALRFVPNLASISHPLRQLLQKDQKFVWSTQCEQAFLKLKQLIQNVTP